MAPRTDRLLLTNAMLGQFISGFGARSFVIGLPTIASALGADILGISWAIIAYQLAGISLAVVFGRLGDIHGRYVIYGSGFAIMAVSSILCGIAPNVSWLIAFRVIAGIGAAMLASATRVLAMEAMPEHAAGRANGFMTMSFHGGMLLGPPVGGFVIDALSWRWVFFILVPIAVAGVVLTVLRARDARRVPTAGDGAIDYGGAALLIVLTVALTLLVDRRSAALIGFGQQGLLAVVFGAAFVGFLVHERRAAQPVVNFALFRIRMFSFSILSLMVLQVTTSALFLVLPFYLQGVQHHSPSFIGLVFLAAPIFTVALAPLTGRITDTIGPRVPTSLGVLVTMAAFAVGMLLREDSHWMLSGLLMAFTGIGPGFFNTANQTAVLTSVPRDYRGFATGMVQMAFGLGALLGTALGTVLLTVMFRYASGRPDAVATADDPASFVFALNATCAACLAITSLALGASFLRGGGRVGAAPR
jgi:EmrB/QacA subfamily drug resistance transporter